ncbi:MAG: zinc-binding alcohol dehydrogenase [Candidatus Latescibacterota bacterium]|nr:zinc-binding alcohol dehydrogenase [Candidatus Latescibacterota bacterium]
MDSANIVLIAKKKVEVLRESLGPLPKEGLIIKTRKSLISTGTECICYSSDMDEGSHWAGWVKYPFYLGYSNVSEIIETGTQVENYKIGDRIFSSTSHRQYATVTGQPVIIPPNVSDESAIWSKLATITQTGVRRAEIKMGARVLIIGAGPLGQLLTQYVKLMGAETIMIIDPIGSRLKVAQDHGATEIFDGSAADALPFVEENTHGNLADVVFDATGHYSVFPMALKLTRRFGTLILIGDSPHPSKQVLTADVLTRQITVRGTHNEVMPPHVEQWDTSRQIELFHTFLKRKQMYVEDLITEIHSPENAPNVYANLAKNRGESIGVVFDWDQINS